MKWAEKGVSMSQQDLFKSKRRHVQMLTSCGLTHQQKNILPPKLHSSLLSRTLAKPRHNPHPLLALQSAILAARAHTPEEYSFSGLGLCYSSPFGSHSHTWKETYFVPPITVPMEHATKAQGSCTLVVCVIQPCSHLSQHGLCVLLCFSSHKKWRSHRQPSMTMPPLQQYQYRDIHPTCRW